MIADVTRSLGTDYYLLDELFTDEEREIRDRVRAFADAEVIPIINEYWEKAEFPFELVPKVAELNIAGGHNRGVRVSWHEPCRGGARRHRDGAG